MGEDFLDRLPEVRRHQLEEPLVGDGGQAVEEVLELVGDRPRQQVLAQAQDLPQLDVGRPQELQPPPQLHGKRLAAQLAAHQQAEDRGKEAQQQDRRPPPLLPGQLAQVGGEPPQGEAQHVALGGPQAAQEALAAGVDEPAVSRLLARLGRIVSSDEGGVRRRLHGSTCHFLGNGVR